MDSLAAPKGPLNLALVLAIAAIACVPLFFLPPAAAPWVLGALGGLVLGFLFIHAGQLLVLLLVWLLVTSVFPDYFWKLNIPGFFNFTADRILLIALIVLFLIALPLGRVRLVWPGPLGWAVVLLVGWSAVSAQVAGWQTAAVTTTGQAIGPPYYRFFVGFLFPAGVFFMTLTSIRSETQVRTTLIFLSAFGLYLTVVGLAQKFGWDSLVWPRFILDTSLGIHPERARGPFLNAPDMGLTLVICFFANLLLLSKVRFIWAVPILLITLPIPVVIFWTLTRSIWLAFVLCLFLTVWLWPRSHRMRVVASMLIVAGLITLTALLWPRLSSSHREIGGMAEKAPIISRVHLALVSIDLAREHPLVGVGLGRFQEAALRTERMRSYGSAAFEYARGAVEHNNFLSMLAETGIPGAVVYIVLVLGLLVVSIRLYRLIPPTATGYLDRRFVVFYWVVWITFFVDSMFRLTTSSPFPNGMFLLMGGLMVGFYRGLQPQPTGCATGPARVAPTGRAAARPGAAG